jgi:hypothetical protein
MVFWYKDFLNANAINILEYKASDDSISTVMTGPEVNPLII